MDRFLLAAGMFSLVIGVLVFSDHEMVAIFLFAAGMAVANNIVPSGPPSSGWDPQTIESAQRRADGIE